MIVKVKASEEGFLDIDLCKVTCVCKFCKAGDAEGALEINFFDCKIYYKCGQCKKMNQLLLTKPPTPLPRTRIV